MLGPVQIFIRIALPGGDLEAAKSILKNDDFDDA